jgi:hypothetical protein
VTYQWQPHQGAASAEGARLAGRAGQGPGTPVRDGIACLDVLAAQMHARGWTAYVSAPADRLASLFVQDPHDEGADGGHIVAAPGGTTGDWWYWFSWAERIAPVHAPEAAADAVISALQQPRALS